MANKDHISWLISAEIRDGKLSEAKEHFQKMVEKTSSDDEFVMDYEFFVNDEEGTVRVYERYPDNGAVMNHMGVVKELLGPMGALIKITHMELFGNPDEKVLKAFEMWKPMVSPLSSGVSKGRG
tara:strand:- start:779 stop:1150 length:372 start_codon:yes stop_codon:yes gene_type:complete